jgi:hypothetical protein
LIIYLYLLFDNGVLGAGNEIPVIEL